MYSLALAVRDAGIRHRLAEAHVERVHHAVGGVKPAESLQDDLVHGTGSLAVYRRAGNAFARQRHTTTQKQSDCGAIMQTEYQRVFGDTFNFEERP